MRRFGTLLAMPCSASRAVRVAVSLVALVTVALMVGSEEVLSRLAQADPALLAAAFLALNAQTVLCAARWRLTASRVGQRIGIYDAVVEYYLAQLINQVAPGGVVGDVSRAARVRHLGGLAAAGQAVALERLSGQIALAAVGITAITATAVFPGGLRWPPVVGFCIAALVASLLLLRLLSRNILLRERMPRIVGKAARVAWRALAAPEVRYRQIVLSLGTTLCNILAFAFCAWATGTDLSLGAAAALVPLILTAMLIPVGIAGWGFREGAAAALMPLAGASAGAGAAASVAFGAMLLASSGPGFIPLVLGARRTQDRAHPLAPASSVPNLLPASPPQVMRR